MAIGTPVNRGVAGGTTTATTSSFTPSADDLLICIVHGRRNTSLPAQPTISDSLGGTWTEVIDQSYDPGANPRVRARMFRQRIGGSPASMTVTGTISDGTITGVGVISVSGASDDLSNVVANNNATGDPSCTVAAVAGTSAVAGFCACNATNLVTQVAGFTELFDTTINAAMQLECAYDLSSPSTTLSWTSTNTNTIGIAFEIKEASAGGVTVNVTGQEATTSLGDEAVEGDAIVSPTGEVATTALGTVAAGGVTTVNVTGQSLTTTLGSVNVNYGSNVSPSGQAITMALGTVVAGSATFVSVTGQQLDTSLGDETIRISVSAAVTGQAATAVLGNETVQTVTYAFATGQQLTTTIGSVTVPTAATVQVTGQQLTMSLNGVYIFGWIPEPTPTTTWTPVTTPTVTWTPVTTPTPDPWTPLTE